MEEGIDIKGLGLRVNPSCQEDAESSSQSCLEEDLAYYKSRSALVALLWSVTARNSL